MKPFFYLRQNVIDGMRVSKNAQKSQCICLRIRTIVGVVMKFGRALSSILFASVVSPAFGGDLVSDVNESAVKASKMSPLGLYVSSSKAHRVLTERPDILFIDVRDPVEVALAGHPSPIDKVVSVRLQSDVFDPALNEFVLVPNKNFVKQMDAALKETSKSRDDVIFVSCGSGYRSAEAVRILAKAGYTNVWQIPDGYEGDEKRGMNTEHAWRNAGLPWSKDLVTETPWVKVFQNIKY